MLSSFADSHVGLLERQLGADWKALKQAHAAGYERRRALSDLFARRRSSDASIVVFGSVARLEVTSGSDTDWILLLDGSATPEHRSLTSEVKQTLRRGEYIEPGSSGIFGTFVSSHDLVHRIGGEDDSNSNTTRRVLLLLESFPLGDREAYDRVRKQLLRRYIEDDRGLTHGSGDFRVPRFLLNDLTRYWRTVTVDFVYKQAAGGKNWALRNAKLRMSRKLLFAAGLLRCFFCHLDPLALEARRALRARQPEVYLLLQYMEEQFSSTPLESIAKACLEFDVDEKTCRGIFNSYDRFLALLDDEKKRKALESATDPDGFRAAETWAEVREMTKPFHEGLVNLFLRDNADLKTLTMEYGLF